MADASRVAELVQDVRDTLEVGSYGLYELVWTLNSGYPELSPHEKIDDAQAAVEQLVEDGDVQIAVLTWPSEDFQRVIPIEQLTAASYEPPSDGLPYLALVSARS